MWHEGVNLGSTAQRSLPSDLSHLVLEAHSTNASLQYCVAFAHFPGGKSGLSVTMERNPALAYLKLTKGVWLTYVPGKPRDRLVADIRNLIIRIQPLPICLLALLFAFLNDTYFSLSATNLPPPTLALKLTLFQLSKSCKSPRVCYWAMYQSLNQLLQRGKRVEEEVEVWLARSQSCAHLNPMD